MKIPMKKKPFIPKTLLAVFAVGILSACGQTNSGAQTAVPQAEQIAKSKIIDVRAIKAHELLQAKPDIVVLDIRTPSEFNAAHIEGAININYYSPNFASEIAKLDKSKEYLVYCRSGSRTSHSMSLFKQAGFSHIIHLKHGLIDWHRSKLELVK